MAYFLDISRKTSFPFTKHKIALIAKDLLLFELVDESVMQKTQAKIVFYVDTELLDFRPTLHIDSKASAMRNLRIHGSDCTEIKADFYSMQFIYVISTFSLVTANLSRSRDHKSYTWLNSHTLKRIFEKSIEAWHAKSHIIEQFIDKFQHLYFRTPSFPFAVYVS